MGRLLEREPELAALDETVAAAVAGRGGTVLIGGEAGIGKTALVRALRDGWEGRASFLTGACEPLSVPAPLQPLRELLEAVEPGEPPNLDGGDRLSLARRVLDALSRRAPAVAVVEDAHWADAATLDVIRILARRLEERPIALVVTYRYDVVGATPRLRQLLGGLAGEAAPLRLAPAPLSASAVSDLAAAGGVEPGELARTTGGNPFLVVEAIAAGGRLPATVMDAAMARAGQLAPPARAVVEAAAVIGRPTTAGLLDAVAPADHAAIEEALARGVMVAEGAALGFRHELIREAIEASIPPPRRAELHGRAFAALLRSGGAGSARLAHHAELAGLKREACEHAEAAAAEAEGLGALSEASRQSERALRLGGHLSAGQRFELLLRNARSTNFASGSTEDALGPAQEAVALARDLGDATMEGRAQAALAWVLWSMDRVLDAKSAADRALEVLERTDDLGALARAHSTQLRIEATALDPAGAIEAGPGALEIARRAGSVEARTDIEISIALARGHAGEPESLSLLADAARTAREAGLTIQAVRAHVNLVFLAATLRRHATVETAAAEAGALFEEFGAAIPAHVIELYRARSLFDRGRWEEALAVAGRHARNYASDAWMALMIGGLAAARRGSEGAEEALERAWSELRGLPESSRRATLRAALVEAAWLRGDRSAALALLRDAGRTRARTRFARPAAELAVWAQRFGLEPALSQNPPEPLRLELAGDWRGAIAAWRGLEAPYEAALAALPGDDRAARAALADLRRLGADAAAPAFARHRAASGATVPRGPRRSTLAHPAGLTRREQEVLEVLAGGSTNAAIAAQLHLSERTVAHHVSAVLRKLEASSRLEAVQRARGMGLLAQVGQPELQR
jgi:DNA-binding CsgD family transcriptional regulator